MSEYFEKNREEYIARLFNVSADGDWDRWIEFCLRGVVSQAKQTIERCERIWAIRETFAKKVQEVGGSIRLSKIVDDIFQSPFCESSILSSGSGSRIRRECGRGTTCASGNSPALNGISPKTYYAPEVFGVAYEELQ